MFGLDALAMACEVMSAIDGVPPGAGQHPEDKLSIGGLLQRPMSDHGSAAVPTGIDSHKMQVPYHQDDGHATDSGAEEVEDADGAASDVYIDEAQDQHVSPSASAHHSPRKDLMKKCREAATKYRRHKSKVIIKTNKVVYLPTTFMEESFDVQRLPIEITMVVEANGCTVERHRVSIKAIPRQGLSTMYCMTNVMDFQQHYLHWQITHWTKLDDQHIMIHLQAPNSSSASSLIRSASTPAPRPGQTRRPAPGQACEPLSGQPSLELHDVANTAGLMRSLSAAEALHDGHSTDGSASDMGGDVIAGDGCVRRSARAARMTPHMMAVLQQEKLLTGNKRVGKKRSGPGNEMYTDAGLLRKRRSQELLMPPPLDAAIPGGPRCIITSGHTGRAHCQPGWEPSIMAAHLQHQVITDPPRLPGALSLFGSTSAAALKPCTPGAPLDVAAVNVGILGPSMPSRALAPSCKPAPPPPPPVEASHAHSEDSDRSPSSASEQPGMLPASPDSATAGGQPGMLQPDHPAMGTATLKLPAPGWMSDMDKNGHCGVFQPGKLVTGAFQGGFKRFKSGDLGRAAGEAETLESGSTTSGTPASATTTCSLGLPVSSFFSAGSMTIAEHGPDAAHIKHGMPSWTPGSAGQPAVGLPAPLPRNMYPYQQECSSEAGMRALLASWSHMPVQPSPQMHLNATAQAWAMLGMPIPGMPTANPSSILAQAFLDMFPGASELSQQAQRQRT